MPFPFEPPVEPMLAKPTPAIPHGPGWIYEPKWDGFRAIVFRNGDELLVQSRDLKPLDRYFPELEAPLRALGGPDARWVLDGEIVIARNGALDFDSLLLRIHPAASRVAMLAAETPASYVAFDCLADGAADLRDAESCAAESSDVNVVCHVNVVLKPVRPAPCGEPFTTYQSD